MFKCIFIISLLLLTFCINYLTATLCLCLWVATMHVCATWSLGQVTLNFDIVTLIWHFDMIYFYISRWKNVSLKVVISIFIVSKYNFKLATRKVEKTWKALFVFQPLIFAHWKQSESFYLHCSDFNHEYPLGYYDKKRW